MGTTKPTDEPVTDDIARRARALKEALDKKVASTPFYAFSPFDTYSEGDGIRFFRAGRKAAYGVEGSADSEALWVIGRDAYRLLEIESRDQFNQGLRFYLTQVEVLRLQLVDLCNQGGIVDNSGKPYTAQALGLEQREGSEILALTAKAKGDKNERGVLLAYACLREIDNALIAQDLGGSGAVATAIHAANALADAQACLNGSSAFRQVRSQMAYAAAMAKHKNDPKQEEKRFVFSCYEEWCRNPDRYKSKAAFARDMLDKCEHLTSQKKIEDWVREWEKASTIGTVPAR